MENETTLLLIKPDGVQRALIGEIVGRIERKGFKIRGLKMIHVERSLAELHYAEHRNMPFYEGLITFITSSPIVAMAISGKEAVSSLRQMMGATNPTDAQPGTIRHDLAMDIGRNLVHGSANLKDAERELSIFFSEEEILDYNRNLEVSISE